VSAPGLIGRAKKDLLRGRKRRLPGKMRWLQLLRRTIQFSVLALLFLIPTLSAYDNLRNQGDDAAIARHTGTKLVHSVVGGMDDHRSITQSVRGSVWTFKAGNVVVSDPLAGVDFAMASRTAWDPFFLTLLIPILLTLLLGRVFCGWICPADLLFEFASKLRAIAGIETNIQFSRLTKYAILGIGAVAAFWLGTQVFAEVYPPRVLSGELYLWISFGLFGAGTWFLLAIVVFEVFVSERFWCRYVCPGGALYSLLGRYRLLRIKVKQSACTSCEKCQPVCEFGLDPMRGEMGQECNNCGLCIRACAPKALVYQISLPKKGLELLP
jgi:ferredoxin-type protein NapH